MQGGQWGAGCQLGLDFREIFLVLFEEGGSEARVGGGQCRGLGGSGPPWTRDGLGEKRRNGRVAEPLGSQ